MGYDAGVGIELLTERHAAQIEGVVGCWDRMLVFGTLPKICYAEGMTSYLFAKNVRIFDYPRFADLFRNQLRENAERLSSRQCSGDQWIATPGELARRSTAAQA